MISSPRTPPAPTPPDPAVTSALQTQSNRDTATAQARLGATNQITPYGNLTYTAGAPDAAGIPQYTATQTFSPSQQALYDQSNQQQMALGQIGLDQTNRIGGLLGTPINLPEYQAGSDALLNNNAVEGRLFDLANRRLEPQLARDWSARETALMNRGIVPGSENYTQELDAQGRARNDAYNQLALTGRAQSFNEGLAQTQLQDQQRLQDYQLNMQRALTMRNQPINEITALMSGSQVSQPNFINPTSTAPVQPTNVGGIYNDSYANQVNAWNAQANRDQSSYNAQMGGLFGLGSAAATLPFAFMRSDRRVKKNVRVVGGLNNGLPVYSFNFKSGPTQIGLMAQDVEKVQPEAVIEISGVKYVNYEMAVR